ncbi:hypothetical protein ACHAWF_017389 [Thalassiosira exigua]
MAMDMDPELTWEILARLSTAASPDRGAGPDEGIGDSLPPFFAQRADGQAGEEEEDDGGGDEEGRARDARGDRGDEESRREEEAVAVGLASSLEERVLGALSGATVPTPLTCLFERSEEVPESAVAAVVEALLRTGRLRGALAGGAYVPRAHARLQRELADAFYRDNGYLTEGKCAALGLSWGRAGEFVRESFLDAILLKRSIVDPDRICRPLEGAVQLAVLNRTFADLKSHLPPSVASCEEDVSEIVENQLNAVLREGDPRIGEAFQEGTTIIRSDTVIFFSADMTKECEGLLPALAEECGRQRAQDIVKKDGDKREKRRFRPVNAMGEGEPDVLHDVAAAVGEKYPQLLDLQHQYEHSHYSGRENEEKNGPLFEFCRSALMTDEFRRELARSTEAEIHLRSLESIATRARQMEGDVDVDLLVHTMKRELLLGCGSSLARLITEYFLFKHADEFVQEDCSLFFEQQRGSKEGTAVIPRSHFEEFDVATLNFPSFVLKYRVKNGTPDSPTKYLRSTFPGSAGLNLSQLWSLCSDEDHCGVDMRVGEKLASFIHHLEDICLTMVGIPYAVLDKKTEHKLLAAQREGVLQRLENSQNEEEAMMCASVLIAHQVKNLQISGTETIQFILKLFERDKKYLQSCIRSRSNGSQLAWMGSLAVHHKVEGGCYIITSWTHKRKILCSNSKGRVYTTEKRGGSEQTWNISSHPSMTGVKIHSVKHGRFLAFSGHDLYTFVKEKDTAWHLEPAHGHRFFISAKCHEKRLSSTSKRPKTHRHRGAGEKWVIKRAKVNGHFTILSQKHGKYLGSSKDGKLTFGKSRHDWAIVASPHGGIYIQSIEHGLKLSCDRNGHPYTTEASGGWETWHLEPIMPRTVSGKKMWSLAGIVATTIATAVAMPFAVMGVVGALGFGAEGIASGSHLRPG